MVFYVSDKLQYVYKDDIQGSTMDACVEYCTGKEMLAIDTETTGLDFTIDEMLLFQIGDKHNQFVINVLDVDISPLLPILTSVDVVKIFHNSKFDYKFLRKLLGVQIEKIYDTMLAEAVLECGKDGVSKSLSATAKRHLGIELSKEARSAFIANKTNVFSANQILYAAKDIEVLFDIYDAQKILITKYGLGRVVSLENYAALAFADIEFNGMMIDTQKWISIAEDVSKDVEDVQGELYDMVGSDPLFKSLIPSVFNLSLFDDQETARRTSLVRAVNFSSPTQTLKLFRTISPMLDSVGAPVLSSIRGEHPIVNKYIMFKEKEKLYNSYGPSFLEKYVKKDGRVHTSFNQVLNTGRVSSSGPNMQQIPANNLYRNAFIADSGWVFVSSDFSSQELCIIATGSNDPVWLEALEKGQDLHSVCAELVFGERWKRAAKTDCKFYLEDKAKCDCPEHGKLRTHVKSINFGLAYGMSAHKLSDTLRIPLEDADNLISKYFSEFPRIKHFLNSLGKFGTSNGYIRTFPPYQRIRWFSDWKPKMKDTSKMGAIERASKNTPIQGSGADMVKEALVLMRRAILRDKLPVKIVMTVHDQIDTIVLKEYAPTWKIQMKEIMETAALSSIPSGLLKSDTNISISWEK